MAFFVLEKAYESRLGLFVARVSGHYYGGVISHHKQVVDTFNQICVKYYAYIVRKGEAYAVSNLKHTTVFQLYLTSQKFRIRVYLCVYPAGVSVNDYLVVRSLHGKIFYGSV